MHILTIDPALDGVGLAVFDYDRFRHQTRGPAEFRALRALVWSDTLSTSASTPLSERLEAIAIRVASLVREWEAELVYVELPAYSGTYDRGGPSRENLNRLYMGIGACLAGASVALSTTGGRLQEVRAGTSKKSERKATLEQVADQVGIRLPQGPRGGGREDEIDAIWIGWWALLNRVAFDRKSPEEAPAVAGGRR